MSPDEALEQAARVLTQARYVTALTGAGVSTPSGIPDFRSLGSGLWESVDPFEVATIYSFRRRPEAFYSWVRPLVHLVVNAAPNAAHFALAELGKLGLLNEIITQNIDGLHQRADSKVVYEVHGNLRQATCIRCYNAVPAGPMIREFMENGAIPRCEKCDGAMKPDIILFGEQLPAAPMIAAKQAARRCDVMIVAGSSLRVAPAGDLPMLTKHHGGTLIIVNLEPTYLDGAADIVIRDDVAVALPKAVAAVGRIRDEAK
jgi:NAD-dependent deacetylase